MLSKDNYMHRKGPWSMMVLLQFLVHKTLTCWLPGTKVRPLLHDFSQAQVIPQRKKIEKADLWSDPAHLYLFIYFLNSAQVLCMLETKTLLLLCLTVILFSEDFFFQRMYLIPDSIHLLPRSIFYFPSKVCLSWIQNHPDYLLLCFYSALSLCRLPVTKIPREQIN